MTSIRSISAAALARLAAGVAVAAATFGTACAADMPDFLRGSLEPLLPAATYMNWSGVYFGAQAGYSNMSTNFGDSSNSIGKWVAQTLRNSTLEENHHPEDWVSMPTDLSNSANWGVFIGYNIQWDQLVLGLDFAYNRMTSMTTSGADLITRKVTDPADTVQIYGRSQMHLIDYATLRGRAGYAFGQFLPYGILGLAVGRFNYATSARLTVRGDDYLGPVTMSERKNDAAAAGFVTGLGLDVALMPNVFLRSEWEFVAFTELSGIRSTVNTGRVGLGVKF
ncbi:MAG TPA: outer membrane beta-barrel protein [Pseudolabrys sp.]|nr:outer membrane beta-barrel protein [Pseudolabrys sp.]